MPQQFKQAQSRKKKGQVVPRQHTKKQGTALKEPSPQGTGLTPSAATDSAAHHATVFEFEAHRQFRTLFQGSPPWLAGLIAFTAAIGGWLLTAVIHGNLGSLANISPVDDIQRFFGRGPTGPTPTEFPFLRDIVSMAIAAIGSISLALIIHQWRVMQFTIRDCVANGVLTPREPTEDAPNSLQSLMQATNRRMRSRPVQIAAILLTLTAVVLLEVSPSRNGLFINLSNIDDPASASKWAEQAYQNWWASSNNPGSWLAYHLVLFLFAWSIALQNVAGIATLWIASRLDGVARISFDEYDTDKWHGWEPMVRLLRTVRRSLALHGFGIGFLVLLIGTQNIVWLSFLIFVWLTFVVAYLVYPWYVLSRGINKSREKRINELTRGAKGSSKVEEVRAVKREIAELRNAKISAVGLRPSKLAFWLATIAGPVFLALVIDLLRQTAGGT